MVVASAVVSFAPLDAAIFALLLGGLLALGFSAKLRKATSFEFLAAGRRLTLPVFVATLVSTWYGGVLGIGESVQYYGLGTWVLMGVPYYVFGIVYALWLAPRVRDADQISLPERFAVEIGRRSAIVGAGLVFLLAVPAAHVLMLGVLVKAFTGWSMVASVLAATAVGTAFLYKGGLLADARASIVAFVSMYVGFAVMLTSAVRADPGLLSRHVAENGFQWDGGMGWPFVASFFILGAWTLVDPGFHQRVASAESPTTGRRGVLASVACWFVFDMLTIGTGMYAVSMAQTAEPLLLFPALGESVLGPGLKALFIFGLVGTVVSAMVGYTLVAGASLARDLAARVAKNAPTDERIVGWTRIGFAVSSLVAIGLALQIQSVVALWYAWAGAVVGALLVPVWHVYRRGAGLSDAWTAGAMALSFAVSASWLAYGTATGNPYLSMTLPNGQDVSIGTLLPGLLVSVIVLGVGALAERRTRRPAP